MRMDTSSCTCACVLCVYLREESLSFVAQYDDFFSKWRNYGEEYHSPLECTMGDRGG